MKDLYVFFRQYVHVHGNCGLNSQLFHPKISNAKSLEHRNFQKGNSRLLAFEIFGFYSTKIAEAKRVAEEKDTKLAIAKAKKTTAEEKKRKNRERRTELAVMSSEKASPGGEEKTLICRDAGRFDHPLFPGTTAIQVDTMLYVLNSFVNIPNLILMVNRVFCSSFN
jgi:hypothetical protein